ncbi:preprotein translocase subunit SecG [Solimonas marina]|uniref:Protein-export membrane protein SecG n=1 Tax=Solimonas marina TaxID=2714601 RepID=A0A969WAW7_9GAMM|nr:preprotein translocase subunit SecG [Solimonas marina]NKF22638.1 preprotein translocase subunit SecG [Solimonas marina]
MYTILVIVQVLAAVGLVGLILIQHGKGADAGAAFGSGASGTVFGSRGSANFLSRATAWLATVFFCVSLALAYLVHGQQTTSSSVMDRAAAAAPATPAPAPADADKKPESTPDTAAPAATPAAPSGPESANNEEKKSPAVPE